MRVLTTLILFAFGAFLCGCNATEKMPVAAGNKTNESSAAPTVSSGSTTNGAPDSIANKPAANTAKAPANEPQPQKVDAETVYSPVYDIDSKNCKNLDGDGSEGEDITRKCSACGDYSLWAYGSKDLISYRIESEAKNVDFVTYLFPLETGDARDYVRADLYALKLGDKIEWRLDEKGKPYAIIVRASFYKNAGAKPTENPKNKVAEFLLVRGLAGHEGLKEDVMTKDTAYNPNEWARKIAYEFLEEQRRR